MPENRVLILDADRLTELRLLGWQLDDHSVKLLGDVPVTIRGWGESTGVVRLLRQFILDAEFDARGEAVGELVPGVPICAVAWGECIIAALPRGISALPGALLEFADDRGGGESSLQMDLSAMCVHPPEGANMLVRSAAWAVASERLFRDSREAIVGYASELSTAYETIDFLCKQGGLMHQLETPDAFVKHLCDGLSKSHDLSWAAIHVLSGGESAANGVPGLYVSGEATLSANKITNTIQELLRHNEIRERTRVLAAGSWGPYSGGRELLARVIDVAGKLGAVIIGGTAHPKTRITSHEVQLVDASSELLSAFLNISRLWNAEQDHMMLTLESLVRAIDAKDPYTSGHSNRVAWLSYEIAKASGMDDTEAERARVAGLVHDIGKIGVSEAVLCKSGALTEEEFAEIKQHPEIGFRILERLPHLDDVRPAVLSHHERWDGRGYPNGLAGEEIPLLARIVGLADTFDAMSSNRSYRPAMNRDVILSEIREVAGKQCDERLVEAFLRVELGPYDEMLARHAAQRVVGEVRSAA